MILKGIRDHTIPNLHGKETTFQMWKSLIDIFESNSDSIKLSLKNKLRIIQMGKDEPIVTYLF